MLRPLEAKAHFCEVRGNVVRRGGANSVIHKSPGRRIQVPVEPSPASANHVDEMHAAIRLKIELVLADKSVERKVTIREPADAMTVSRSRITASVQTPFAVLVRDFIRRRERRRDRKTRRRAQVLRPMPFDGWDHTDVLAVVFEPIRVFLPALEEPPAYVEVPVQKMEEVVVPTEVLEVFRGLVNLGQTRLYE